MERNLLILYQQRLIFQMKASIYMKKIFSICWKISKLRKKLMDFPVLKGRKSMLLYLIISFHTYYILIEKDFYNNFFSIDVVKSEK